MSHNNTTTLSQSLPAMPQRTCYSATVVEDGESVLIELYAERWQRRNAVVELLGINHDEVDVADVQAILDSFGGADPDEALAQITALYADFGVDVYLDDVSVPSPPQELWSVYTDYGDGTYALEHFYSREQRRESLRERCETLSTETPEDLDEQGYVDLVRTALQLTSGTVSLHSAVLTQDGSYYRAEG